MTNLEKANIRDQIISGEPYDSERYTGGTRYFDKLTVQQIRKLDIEGLLDRNETQNYAPSVGDIYDFLANQDGDGWYAHGYVVSPERDDFRLSFEGAGKSSSPTMKQLQDFISMFRYADDFDVGGDGLYAWFD